MAGGMALQLVGLLLAAAAGTVAAGAPAAKKAAFGVRARLLSGWPRTPSAAQSLEWLRDVDAGGAGAVLRQLGKGAAELGAEPAEGRLRASSARTFHELLVRNSYYSPRIEALRTLERRDRRLFGAACPLGAAWALVWRAGASGPTAACGAAELRSQLALAADAATELPAGFVPSELDITVRSGLSKSLVVIYGALSSEGLPSLAPLLREVDALAGTSPWRALFRHADGPSSDAGPGADTLTGYGFELAIKSSEYKTHADEEKKEQEEGEAQPGDVEAGEGEAEEETPQLEEERKLEGELELDGLLFHVLLDRHQGPVRSGLWALKEQLEVERDTDKLLKAWEINDIGLQATARIKSSPAPLLALMRLSQDFPAQVVGLARANVPESLRRSATKLRRTVPDSAEVFSVNGRLVRPDHSDLSLFPMMKTLHSFFVGVERLVRLGLSEKLACALLQDAGAMKVPDRLEWRSPLLAPPVYVVTKDKKTSRWPGSLYQAMMFASGGLAPARVVLYHMVFVFDPAEAADFERANEMLMQMPLPAALHFVMVPGTAAAAGAAWDEEVLGARPEWLKKSAATEGGAEGGRFSASAAIAAAYGYLLQMKPVRARAFIKALAQDYADRPRARWGDSEEGLARLRELWLAALAQDQTEDKEGIWDSLMRGAGERGSMGSNATQYVNSLGIPVPCLLLNGQLLLKGVYEGQQKFFPSIVYEQQLIQQALFQQRLSEDTKIADFIASKGLLDAYHEDITPHVAQRGGEEGMQKESSPEVNYLHWPAEPLLATPFLESLEPELPVDDDSTASGSAVRLGSYHVTVLRGLEHAYLLHTFASHLLAPDRASLLSNAQISVPPLTSYWTAIVEAGEGGTALAELAACVRGAMQLEAASDDTASSLNRQRLLLLKFLGAAIPAAVAADSELPAARVRELCELGVQKKIDPGEQERTKALIAEMRGRAPSTEQALLAAAAGAGGEQKRRAALWVCNGRMIPLQASGQPVFSRHVQALEVMEAQYDISHRSGQAEDEYELEPDSGFESCTNTCIYPRDGVCDDPRGTKYCELGTDCQDCGPVGADNFTRSDDDGWWDDDDDYWTFNDGNFLDQTKGLEANRDKVRVFKKDESAGPAAMFLVVLEGMVYTVGAIFAAAALYLLNRWYKGQSVPFLNVFNPETAQQEFEMSRPAAHRVPITPDEFRT